MSYFLRIVFAVLFQLATVEVVFAIEEPVFSTAILKKDCACSERRYEGQEYETVAVTLVKGFVLGKFCRPNEESVASEPETLCRVMARGTEVSAALCPTRCLRMKETLRLSLVEQKNRKNEGVRILRETYQKTLPPKVLLTLDAERPQWKPVLYIRGEKNYELEVRPYSPFYLEAPYLEKGELRDYSIVLFHDAPKEGDDPTGWIGVFEKDTGKVVKWIEYLQMGTYSDSYLRKMKIFLAPPPASALYLRMTEWGVSDASTMEWGPVGPEMKEVDDSFDTRRMVDLPEQPKESANRVKLIDGPASLRAEPSVSSRKIGECADRAYAVIRAGDVAQKAWVFVFCEGKRGWTHQKNIRYSPKR